MARCRVTGIHVGPAGGGRARRSCAAAARRGGPAQPHAGRGVRRAVAAGPGSQRRARCRPFRRVCGRRSHAAAAPAGRLRGAAVRRCVAKCILCLCTYPYNILMNTARPHAITVVVYFLQCVYSRRHGCACCAPTALSAAGLGLGVAKQSVCSEWPRAPSGTVQKSWRVLLPMQHHGTPACVVQPIWGSWGSCSEVAVLLGKMYFSPQMP